MRVRFAALTAAVIAAVLLTSACSTGDSTTGHQQGHSAGPTSGAPAATTSHNQADITFAQGMIPHHLQAVEMSGMAAGQEAGASVRQLAAAIEKAQAPEIRTMTGWLTSWGAALPAPAPSTMSGHGGHEGHGGMPGMMSAEDMKKLRAARGPAFDRMFLTMMIAHHQGAVAMATTERTQGKNAAAKALAGTIISAQKAEITTMTKMLKTA